MNYSRNTDGSYRTVTRTRYNAEGNPPVSAQKSLVSNLSDTSESKNLTIDERNLTSTQWEEYHNRTKRKTYNTLPTSNITAEAVSADGFTLRQTDNAGVTSTAGCPLDIQKDGTWYTYGWDLTKNICELYGTNGYIRTTYTYSPYGAVTVSANSVYQPIQWSSEFHDDELALVYYNYRHYNPTDGRWLGRDRIIEKNAYLSLRNSTIQHYDYLGNIIIPLLFAKAIKEYLYYKEDCLKKRAKALNELKSIVFSKSGPKPNCSARNCSTITIIIEIGDPCKCYPYYLVGHTGIGINGDYYDLGPDGKEIIPGVNENVKPWWRKDENDPNIKPEALSYILSNLETEFSYYPTVVATFCACNETANKARKYWDKKYENMKNKSKCTYSIFGLNCSTSVWESLDISSGISDFSPECLLKNEDMLAQLSNQCGSLKGHPAHLELVFDRFE